MKDRAREIIILINRHREAYERIGVDIPPYRITDDEYFILRQEETFYNHITEPINYFGVKLERVRIVTNSMTIKTECLRQIAFLENNIKEAFELIYKL